MTETLTLIIEDDLFLADIFSTTLRMVGFQTEVFNDGISAMARLAQITPALVVLDLNLPGIPGIQILGQIRRDKRLRRTPILVATANLAQAELLKSQMDEYLHIILKPVPIGDLLQFARRIKSGMPLVQPSPENPAQP